MNNSDKYNSLRQTANNDEEALIRLIETIKVLREECPWDKVQTHDSLKPCLIEEAYEVCDAIDKKDIDLLKEELGDVLLQVVFHSNIEVENNNFSFKDIANNVTDKMIRRHPHVFLKESAKSIDNALEKWENVKRQEKLDMSTTDLMNAIPKSLPALTKSYKVQAKAADVGFDWEKVDEAFLKVDEEAEELHNAVQDQSQNEVAEELGDLLFAIVNVARFLNVDPEQALNNTSQKFINRFSHVEAEAARLGKQPEEMTLDELDAFWEEAKAKERTT